jgi:hypothetical protein
MHSGPKVMRSRWRGSYILGASLAFGSEMVCADPITLLCDVKEAANACCVVDGPGSIVLDEAAKSVTIHYPPIHTKATGEQVGNGTKTVTASFGSDTVAFQIDGRAVTLSRLTGVMVDWASLGHAMSESRSSDRTGGLSCYKAHTSTAVPT